MNLYVGIDIGGTNIKHLVREEDKVLLSGSCKSSDFSRKEDLLEYIFSLIKDIVSKYKIENVKGIGVGSKGRVTEKGVILCSSYPAVNGLDLVTSIEKEYGVKTRVVNDASLPYYAIRGEVKDKKVLIVTLGTGTGTAIFHNDKKVGDEFFSSSFARTKFRDKTNEAYASTNFLLTRAKENNIVAKTPLELFSKGISGDDKAKEIFKEYGQNLGEILSSLVNQYDIEEIHMTGGILNGKSLFLEHMKNSLKKHSKKEFPKIKLIKSKHPVGALGASKLFEEK